MKVSSEKIIVIQEEGIRPARYTDPSRAAEHWARVKADEWLEKNKDNPKYKILSPTFTGRYRRPTVSNTLYDDGRVHYRKFKRRALRVFRRIMDINS